MSTSTYHIEVFAGSKGFFDFLLQASTALYIKNRSTVLYVVYRVVLLVCIVKS